ncbi:MAG: amidohydrolase [Pseudomonadota bacterium]
MIIRPAAALASFALAACGAEAPAPAEKEPDQPFADMVIHGGTIYTGADDQPTAEAVSVVNGAISGVGAYAGLKEAIGENTRVIDLQGAALLPGFTDAHAHLLGIGMRELTLNLEGVSSIAELTTIVAANVQHGGEDEVVYGRGWIETGWPEGRMPTRDDLDAVTGDTPVILERADGHAVVANSAALAAGGVDAQTPDPEGGRIDRDAAGRATGLLIDNAASLVMKFVEAPSGEKLDSAYVKGGDVYAAYGWTGVHNMSVNPEDTAVMERLSSDGLLGLRVYNSVDKAGLEDLVANGHRASDNNRIITRAMKLYVDGALGSRGAALSDPYSDAPDTDGLLLMQKEEALSLFERALAADIQVNTHAIGDRGNKLVLDWYEEAFTNGDDDRRWRIEHSQILHTEDIPRFAALGVIPSMQPSHAIGDLHFAPDRLGPDRLAGAYAWRSLIDAGAVIAGGSDAPVERGDPLIEFYAAVARKDLEGFQGPDWTPEQAVSRTEALKMFTLWPAYASFQEDTLGSIEVGKRADFTVFSADIMTIPEEEIPAAKALMTIVDGEVIFEAGD